MKNFVPNYYKSFHCIANECLHNCCIGWEIDIDEDTYEYYQSIDGRFGKRLKKDITVTDKCACFNLDGKGRCSFLNKNNLCDIILNLGEGALCQICSDHPRFRNFYDDAIEIGLGLCCEEAGRIILGQKEKFELICDEHYEQSTFFRYKLEIINSLQEESRSLKDKIFTLLDEQSIKFKTKNFNEWVDFYLSLERLEDNWTNLLCDMATTDFDDVVLPEEYEIIFEKLIIYFIYRHLDSADKSKILFSVFSMYFVSQICRYHIKKYNDLQFEDIVEYGRMYSSEIEYSDENVERIIENLY